MLLADAASAPSAASWINLLAVSASAALTLLIYSAVALWTLSELRAAAGDSRPAAPSSPEKGRPGP